MPEPRSDLDVILERHGLQPTALLQILRELSPEMPFLYDPEQLSTQPERFFVAELVREAIFHQFQQEIPYSTEVVIAEFKERDNGK